MGTEETKKYEDRFRVIVGMGVFILFVFIWSAAVSIVGMHAAADNGGSGKAETKKSDSNGEGPDADAEITPADLGKMLLDGVEFSSQVSEATGDMASNLVFVSDQSELHVYMASGSYADEIIIVKSPDEETAESDRTAVEHHLRDKRAEFDRYNADEVKKLDNVYLVCKDCYVVACVSDDTKQAEKIVTEALE